MEILSGKPLGLAILIVLLSNVSGGPNRFKNPPGLYGPNDLVTILTNENLNATLQNRPVASFVEFYNYFCGGCQSFSPQWKALAKNTVKWGSFVQICAIDCAKHDICSQFGIDTVPTVRYFPPYYTYSEKDTGKEFDKVYELVESDLINILVNELQNEENIGAKWPEFEKFDREEWKDVFEDIPEIIRFVFVISDELPGTVAQQTLLDYSSRDKITTRIVNTKNAKLFTESLSEFRLGVVERSTGLMQMLKVQDDTRESLVAAIEEHIRKTSITLIQQLSVTTESPVEDNAEESDDVKFYKQAIKMSPMPLFRADLEQAITFSLRSEIPRRGILSGESLAAARNYVSVLKRYYNFGNKESYDKLLDFLTDPTKTEVSAREFRNLVINVDPPIIKPSRYVGCYSLDPTLRRQTCSLWSLFHYLTVQQLERGDSKQPLEVLLAIHGYVKNFFGCAECQTHFQQMATRNNIYNVTSSEDAVLWLWSAHNEVNHRLHGDITEDVNHPKIQFPSETDCPACHKHNDGHEWDKTEVLGFLRRQYGSDHVNSLGFPESMTKARKRRSYWRWQKQ